MYGRFSFYFLLLPFHISLLKPNMPLDFFISTLIVNAVISRIEDPMMRLSTTNRRFTDAKPDDILRTKVNIPNLENK